MTAPTIDDLIANIDRERRDTKRRLSDTLAQSQAILDTAMASGRTNLTPDEDRRMAALVTKRREAADKLDTNRRQSRHGSSGSP
jgi:hypothetical protein